MRTQLTPYLNFFEMSTSFLTQQQQWLDSRLGSFDPDDIVKETEGFQANLLQVLKLDSKKRPIKVFETFT